MSLNSNEVHVWRSPLDLSEAELKNLAQTLSPDELERAARFRIHRDQRRFVAARGLLRRILARYLGRYPAELSFCYGPFGKPALAFDMGPEGILFNVSHSHEFALFAIALRRELGVDLERIRADFEWEPIAKRFFSPEETRALHSTPCNLKQEAFFNCWTRKEAFVKALGGGLSIPLHQFSVAPDPGVPVVLLKIEDRPQEACNWRLEHLPPSPGYATALAAEGHNWELRCWQWSGHSV